MDVRPSDVFRQQICLLEGSRDGPTTSPAGWPASAALAEPVRRDLYLYVVGQPEPVSRDQAAAGVGVPRHTAKFHLDRLVEEGLLDTEFRRLSGRRRARRRAAGQALPARAAGEVDGLPAGAPLRPRRPAAGRRRSRTPARHGTPVAAALTRPRPAFGAGLGAEARDGRRAVTRPRRGRGLRRARRARATSRGSPTIVTCELPVPPAGPGAHGPGVRHEPRPGRRAGGTAWTSILRRGWTRPTGAAAWCSTPPECQRRGARGRRRLVDWGHN